MEPKLLPTITAERVCLRWISESDIDALFKVFSHPQVMRYWSTPPLADRKAAADLLQEIHKGIENKSMLKWGLALR
ncbi:MAG TPA: GNAT family N-acetyltransferase, partial [Pyrinomonadaceae bacterium]|nr:GNAT family N-acetyltransferase [Pyrinomonadaceae bacterium]